MWLDETPVSEANPMAGQSEFGRRLSHVLKLRDVSQSALARYLRLTRAAVAQWKAGDTVPSAENLRQAAVMLRVSQEWLATGRGSMELPAVEPARGPGRIARVPLLSWVQAGQLTDAQSQIPVEDVPLLAFADLGRGEFFALKVVGDSMDRVSPEESVIVINRADRELVNGRLYVFSVRGETTYKQWHADPEYLAPYSTNPAHQPIFLKRKKDLEVVGRVRRSVLDL